MKKVIYTLAFFFLYSIPLSFAYAQRGGGDTNNTARGGGDTTSNESFLQNPLGNINNFYDLLGAILNNIVIPVGFVVVVMAIIYTGFLFVTAQGDPEKLTKARSSFLWTMIGAVVLLGSWAIANAIWGTVEPIIYPE